MLDGEGGKAGSTFLPTPELPKPVTAAQPPSLLSPVPLQPATGLAQE